MVSWIWMPVMLFIGAIIGTVIMGVIAYDNAEYRRDRREFGKDE